MSMRQVPVRELNQHTADVLARVQMGERVAITRNGVRVAVLEPVRPHSLSRLIESGELRPAHDRLPLFPPSELLAAGSAGSAAVVADRDDGRW